jgi:FkbH-like protein
LAGAMPVVVLAPGIALPPFAHVPPVETSVWELRLNAILIQFLNRILDRDGIRGVSGTSLEQRSPHAGRHDLKMDLLTGFPYAFAHADAVAELSVDCLFPAVPRKGIITDLDETLWSGILGDVGAAGVSWSLEDKSQAHALYQQVLASLADSGVLVAIASKNDPQLVDAALHRHDILLSPERIFPVEAGWGPKSAAIGRILEAWNIGPESVVFVDDSPMELAEVSEKYPAIECLRFPSGDPAAILALLWHLRARFGKSEVREEDRLRLASLRASAALRQESSGEAPADFLSRLEAKVTFETVHADAADNDRRALELVNKTNQFNLNGARYTEAEWKALGARTGAFLATVSYEDRFGPLGRIAVLGGYMDAGLCCVDIWVMSCRAFSRQIEFQTIRRLFDKTGASAIRFRFRATERNGPLQSFFAESLHGASSGEGERELEASVFDRLCPPLFHQVNDKWTIPKTN